MTKLPPAPARRAFLRQAGALGTVRTFANSVLDALAAELGQLT